MTTAAKTDVARPSGAPPDAPVMASMDGVEKDFDGVPALRDFSVSIPAGALVGVIGPSGAGKTTAISLLTGSLRPTKGTVRTLGEDPRRLRRRTRERIGLMPQQTTIYPDLTASENVDLFGSMFGLLAGRRRKRTREALSVVELWDDRRKRASALSGGMQRRLQLACALVHEPELVFLDEPTTGIDPILRQTVWDELARLRGLGRTLVVTTQYVVDAEHCDLVALIADGRLLAYGPPGELRRMALGGEVVQVEIDGQWDSAPLLAMPEVRHLYRIGNRRTWLVVDHAGATIPAVVDALRRAGAQVISVTEYRPSFDEIFAALVNLDAAESDENHAGGGGGGGAEMLARQMRR